MKISRIIAGSALGALCFGVAAADTPFVVRADESPEDSVISIEVGDAPFMLERTGPRQIDLVTPDLTREFDVSGVLALGGGRRLAAARRVEDEEVNRLRLTLGCDCAYGFSISNGRLAITLRAAEPVVEAKAPPRRGSRHAPARAPRPFPRPKSIGAEAAANDGLEAQPSAVASRAAPSDDVLAARQHLLQQLSRAADQGLLEFVSDEAEDAAPPPQSPADRTPPEPRNDADAPIDPQTTARPDTVETDKAESERVEMADDAPLRPTPPTETPVRARTAIDKSFRSDRAETIVAVAPCIPRAALALASWPSGDGFADRAPSLRMEILDEFDQPRPEIVRTLAQTYILNGFGAEAEALLKTYGAGTPDRDVLLDLARIIDGERLSRGGPIAETAPCHGAALLWRRIAGLPHAIPAPRDAIWTEMAEAFSSLPRSVRELVAAPLLSSLVDAGEVSRAEELDRILSRAPLGESAALDLARARLLAAGGDAIAAEELYQRLARRGSSEAHESLIRLLDSRLARGAEVTRPLAQALSDLAFATRGHPLELAAKTAEIRAHAATDGPMAALGAVRDALARLPGDAPVLRDAGHAALERLAPAPEGDAAAAMAYAQAVTMYLPHVSAERDGDAARRSVARELLRIGLANAALNYLAPSMERGEPTVRLAAAEALVALDRPEEALAQLEDLTAPKARELRAAALARAGDFAAAAEADPNDKARALSAGDWEGAAQDDGPRAELASYMAAAKADKAEPKPNAPPTLSGARAAQDAARATRTLIEEALTDG